MIKSFLAALVTYIILDFIWLHLIAGGFYKSQISEFLGNKSGQFDPNIYRAVFVYILVSIAIVFLILPLVRSGGSPFVLGAILGLVIYGVYEFTNYAIFSDWPLIVVLVDTLWGAVVVSLASFVASIV